MLAVFWVQAKRLHQLLANKLFQVSNLEAKYIKPHGLTQKQQQL